MLDTMQIIELVTTTEPEAALAPPVGPVLAAPDCAAYGCELPSGWRCPDCAVAEQCYAALLAAEANGHNGNGTGNGAEMEPTR